jgi:serine/threonine protein phosphatase 1
MLATNGVWVIGDVHGEYDKLIKLLDKLPKDTTICFTGDLIDRGKHSAKVIELFKTNPNYLCVKGNHEEMMIEAIRIKDYRLWKQNGGENTLKSYKNEAFDLNEHLCFLQNLPLFIHFDIPNYKPLVVSHSYIHGIWRGKEYNYSTNDIETILWTHMYDENNFNLIKEKQNNIFNIFGHTVFKEAKISQNYAAIDTGACYDKHGKLTALHYPSMKTIEVI